MEDETDKNGNWVLWGNIMYGIKELAYSTFSYIQKAGCLERMYPHCGSSAKGPYTRNASHLLFIHTMVQLLNNNPGYARQPCEHAWNWSHLGT